jgi:hypothetical protein
LNGPALALAKTITNQIVSKIDENDRANAWLTPPRCRAKFGTARYLDRERGLQRKMDCLP